MLFLPPFFFFLNFMLWKNVSMSIWWCMCMYVCWIYWNGKEENESISKKPRIWDLNSLTLVVWQGFGTWQILAYCVLLWMRARLKLYSISVPKQQSALLTRHIWRHGTWLAIPDLSLSSVQRFPRWMPGLVLTSNFIIGSCWQTTSKWDQHRYITGATIERERSFQKLVSTGDKQ